MASFYAYIEGDPNLALAYKALLEAVDLYEARGRPLDAMRVRRVIAELRQGYERLGVQAAAKSESYIRDRIRQTQVRPDNTGNLLGAIKSAPFNTLPAFPAGEVGIASIEELDKGAVNPRTGGIYWRVQEEGYTGFVGRRVHGYFMGGPGQAPPDPTQFRQHPYFQAQRGPLMIIRRPIRARHFLRRGTELTVAWRVKQAEGLIRRAIASLPRV